MRKTLLLLAALSFGLAMAQDYVFGITFDAGGKFDRSFNEGTWNGLQKAVQELEADGLDIEVSEFEGTPDTAAEGQRRIAQQGADFIVAPGFLQQDAIQSVSQAFPDTSFMLIDAAPETAEAAQQYANVRFVLFKEQEGSFLVGYLAGKLSQTGTVGFVGGMDIPLIHAFDSGYQQGVKAACPDCRVISNYVGVTPAAWNDPAKAKELATSQHAQGADIIYAAAGASGNGVIDFVNEKMCYDPATIGVTLRETPLADAVADIEKSLDYEAQCQGKQPLFFIGVDSNQNYLGDTDNDPDTMNFGLTSMVKRVDVATYDAVMDVVDGTFTGGEILHLGLAEDGVGYALDEYNEALIPDDLQAEVEAIREQIISGDIVVTDPRQQ